MHARLPSAFRPDFGRDSVSLSARNLLCPTVLPITCNAGNRVLPSQAMCCLRRIAYRFCFAHRRAYGLLTCGLFKKSLVWAAVQATQRPTAAYTALFSVTRKWVIQRPCSDATFRLKNSLCRPLCGLHARLLPEWKPLSFIPVVWGWTVGGACCPSRGGA
jgi:hypothetical protein